jgi:hypothetical protein
MMHILLDILLVPNILLHILRGIPSPAVDTVDLLGAAFNTYLGHAPCCNTGAEGCHTIQAHTQDIADLRLSGTHCVP